VRILLDTHAWLWMLDAPKRLTQCSRELLGAAESELLLSAASAWEIAIKHAMGRYVLPGDPEILVPALMIQSRVASLPVAHVHALRVARLPLHHRDPFDRLLVAQAQVEGVPILTSDPHFAAYDVEVIAA
jgi:PIN domain nuclease of toxin-antitoxin system